MKIPQAYKDGVKEFYGREFLVTPDVLIPRPETETMIDMVLSLAGKPFLHGIKVGKSKLPERPRILDVGTGSGCIAITVKLELPNAIVSACDISKPALEIARKNSKKFGVLDDSDGVEFRISNLLSAYNDSASEDECFDLILANLPYVDRCWSWISGVEGEPEIALYAEDSGLFLILELLRQVKGRCKYLILEADPIQHDIICDKAKGLGYSLIKINGYQILLKIS